MTDQNKHTRVNDILLGPLERPALQWLCEHMPAWMTPDILTIIGILGAVVIFLGYVLSNQHPAFLWLASIGYVINWFGDSLDGSLARHRKIDLAQQKSAR
jgi:archaetidylinositol phosphate synthase